MSHIFYEIKQSSESSGVGSQNSESGVKSWINGLELDEFVKQNELEIDKSNQ